jgi:hypothetical protein
LKQKIYYSLIERLPSYFPGGAEEKQEKTVRIAGVQAEM